MVCKPPLAAHRHAHQRKWWEWRGRAVAHLTYLLAAATCLDAAVASLSAAIHAALRCAALCCAVLPAVDSMGPSMEFLKLGSFDALYRHFPPVITHVLKASAVPPCVGGREGSCRQPHVPHLLFLLLPAAGQGRDRGRPGAVGKQQQSA